MLLFSGGNKSLLKLEWIYFKRLKSEKVSQGYHGTSRRRAKLPDRCRNMASNLDVRVQITLLILDVVEIDIMETHKGK
jgi:hypothetical protein